jgi:hypothetical protein
MLIFSRAALARSCWGASFGEAKNASSATTVGAHKQRIAPAGKLLFKLVDKILLPGEVEQQVSVQRQ